jgi:hypothetical protein
MSENLDPKLPLRRAYKKPEMERVSLRPDEAVLGNCKSVAAAGPGGSSNCMPIGTCFTQGS